MVATVKNVQYSTARDRSRRQNLFVKLQWLDEEVLTVLDPWDQHVQGKWVNQILIATGDPRLACLRTWMFGVKDCGVT